MLRGLFKPTSDRDVLVLLATIFGGVTLILVLVAAGLGLHTWSFLHDAETTTGTVVELVGRERCETDNDSRDHRQTCRTVYAPRVRFATADGREIEYLSRTSTNPPRYSEGQQVEVLYRPDDPNSARISSFTDLWLAPLIVGGVGAIFGLIAAVLALIGRALRSNRHSEPEPPSEPTSTGEWQEPGTLR